MTQIQEPTTTGPVGTGHTQDEHLEALGRYRFGWSDSDVAGSTAKRGLTPEVVANISALKSEPQWMLDLRMKGLRLFERKPMPTWGAELDGIDFDNIKYFVRSTEKQATTWDDLPADIKNTYDKLGIPEAEKARLVSGVAAQYESEVVYHKINEELEKQGVIFLDTDTALKEYPDLFREYFATVIPVGDNKFSALNTCGLVRRLVHLRAEGRARGDPAAGLLPDQHREHGPVRADPDHRRRGRLRALRRGLHRADLLLGLAALRGGRDHREEERALPLHHHPELVEQRLQPGDQAGHLRRGRDHGVGRRQHRLQGDHEVPGGLPDGEHSRGETLSIAFAGEGQHQDAGAKMVHCAPHTSSSIISKSVARGGGRTSYRGLVQVQEGAHHSASTVKCDALLVDNLSRSDTYPYVDVREDDVSMGHEATVSKVSDDQLFYLMSRGLGEDEAMAMIVRGFVEPIARELPMEYALELNRLIELQMEGAVG
jgi:Fe-S cluster assembly protein SufB